MTSRALAGRSTVARPCVRPLMELEVGVDFRVRLWTSRHRLPCAYQYASDFLCWSIKRKSQEAELCCIIKSKSRRRQAHRRSAARVDSARQEAGPRCLVSNAAARVQSRGTAHDAVGVSREGRGRWRLKQNDSAILSDGPSSIKSIRPCPLLVL